MVTNHATTGKVVKAGVEVEVWNDLKKLCKKKGDLKERIERAISLYLAISADPSTVDSIDIESDGEIAEKCDGSGWIYVTFRVDEKAWDGFRKGVGEASDGLNRALKVYLGAMCGCLAWVELSIAGTPDFIRTLTNVVYDFRLPRFIGVPTVKVVPVKGKSGIRALPFIIDEALRYRDSDGEEPDSSPAISLRKRGQIEYITGSVKAEDLLERVKEGWDVTIREFVESTYGFVNVSREGVFVTFL